MHTCDVLLVGAGPIGIELAVALKTANIDYLHLDARQVGHTISWFAPQTRFFSSNERIAIAGVPLITPDGNKCTREQYLAYLRGVVELYRLSIRTFEPVVNLRKQGDAFDVATSSRYGPQQYRARHVILCIGGTERPRQLGIPGANLPHVSHYFQEPHLYFGQKLMIVGGRNSAAEAALRCYHAGAHVSISYRQPTLPAKSIKYWLLPELQGLIDAGRITAHFSTTPTRITTSAVTLRRDDGTAFDVPADFALALIGYEADMSLFTGAGATLHAGSMAPLHDPATMETTIPGLYVAGTAAAGTQERYELFLENCHIHVERILTHLQGLTSTAAEPVYSQPES